MLNSNNNNIRVVVDKFVYFAGRLQVTLDVSIVRCWLVTTSRRRKSLSRRWKYLQVSHCRCC